MKKKRNVRFAFPPAFPANECRSKLKNRKVRRAPVLNNT